MLTSRWTDNTLLRSLAEAELRRTTTDVLLKKYDRSEIIYQSADPMEYVVFPLQGAISLFCYPEAGDKDIEVAMLGNEGFLGIPVLLGSETTMLRAAASIETQAVIIGRAAFQRALNRSAPFASICQRYAQAFLAMIARVSLCNGAHLINRRCARWLLMLHDRARVQSLLLTRESFSRTIGVRRASVGAATKYLEQQGLIAFSRGYLTILDRPRLEEFSCPCYRALKSEFNRLLPEHLKAEQEFQSIKY